LVFQKGGYLPSDKRAKSNGKQNDSSGSQIRNPKTRLPI
jgi:hypothetical protein